MYWTRSVKTPSAPGFPAASMSKNCSMSRMTWDSVLDSACRSSRPGTAVVSRAEALPANVQIGAGPDPVTCWSAKPSTLGECGWTKFANRSPWFAATYLGRPSWVNIARLEVKREQPTEPGRRDRAADQHVAAAEPGDGVLHVGLVVAADGEQHVVLFDPDRNV